MTISNIGHLNCFGRASDGITPLALDALPNQPRRQHACARHFIIDEPGRRLLINKKDIYKHHVSSDGVIRSADLTDVKKISISALSNRGSYDVKLESTILFPDDEWVRFDNLLPETIKFLKSLNPSYKTDSHYDSLYGHAPRIDEYAKYLGLTPPPENLKFNDNFKLNNENVLTEELSIALADVGRIYVLADGKQVEATYCIYSAGQQLKPALYVWAPELKSAKEVRLQTFSHITGDISQEIAPKMWSRLDGFFSLQDIPSNLIKNTIEDSDDFLFYQHSDINKCKGLDALPDVRENAPALLSAKVTGKCAIEGSNYPYLWTTEDGKITISLRISGYEEIFELPPGEVTQEGYKVYNLTDDILQKALPHLEKYKASNNNNISISEIKKYLSGTATMTAITPNQPINFKDKMIGQQINGRLLDYDNTYAIIEGAEVDFLAISSREPLKITFHKYGGAENVVVTTTPFPVDPTLQYIPISKETTKLTNKFRLQINKPTVSTVIASYDHGAASVRNVFLNNIERPILAAINPTTPLALKENTMSTSLTTPPSTSTLAPVLEGAKSAALAGVAMAASQQTTKMVTALAKKAGFTAKQLKHPVVRMLLTAGTPMLMRALAPHIPGGNNPKIIAGLDLLQQTSTAQVTAEAIGAVFDVGGDVLKALTSMGQLMLAGEPETEPSATVTQEPAE